LIYSGTLVPVYHSLLSVPAMLFAYSTSWRCLALLSFLPATIWAQGSAADYERATTLEQRTANKVFKATVTPQWMPGDKAFWYVNELSNGRREWIWVDTHRGQRRAAFDHGRLAKQLAEKAGQQVDPERLPLENVQFASAKECTFTAFKQPWRCTLPNHQLTRLETAATPQAAQPLAELQASGESKVEISVELVNDTKQPLELFWVDRSQKHITYGTLAPGASRTQKTFVGHVWLARGSKPQYFAAFAAKLPGARMVFTAKLKTAPAATAKRAQHSVSPNEKWEAYFKNHQLFIRDLSTKQEQQWSKNGSAEDRYEGPILWSPDSKYLLVMQTKPVTPRQVHFVEAAPKDQLQPKLHTLNYPKPGDPLPQARPRLFLAETQQEIPIAEDLFSNPFELEAFQWLPDASAFTFLYNERGHQRLRMIAVAAETGQARIVAEEHQTTFVDYAHKQFAQFSADHRELIWMSERDGWNHLYRIDVATGRVMNQITRGPWLVRGVERVDHDQRQIWFRAGGIYAWQDPYHVHLCRVNFDGTGLVVLTEGDGTHRWTFSPSGKFLIDTWSRVDQPPHTELRRAKDGRLVCELEQADASALLQAGWRMPERFVAKGRDGKTDIYGLIIRPAEYDPAKKYPVVEQIYAGPQGAHVPKEFGRAVKQHALAELGFIVVQIDGMGTSYRSKAFHDVAAKNLADAGFPDRIAWLKAAAEVHPELDLTRVGIFGGSAGGQNAMRALIAHHDFYKVAVADCGCHDNRIDKIWWNELWMGWPIGPHYAEQSNVTNAGKLEGKLMLIVGEVDHNVDPASTMQVVKALVKANKDFDLLVMPSTDHGAAESPYANRRRMDFLVRHLLHVEPRHP
jgi:dipeptidyl aminopeptidase/acylaminoacyl peptidase